MTCDVSRIKTTFISCSVLVLCLCFFSLRALSQTNDVEMALTRDSDGDGATDWEELLAGTNPGDGSNCLEVTEMTVSNEQVVVKWKSVGTSAYEVVCSASIDGLTTNPQHVAFVKADGGVEPWYETLSAVTNYVNGSNLFIGIRLVVPQDFEKSAMDMTTFE